MASCDHDLMRHAARLEADTGKLAELDGMIDQFIVIGGAVAAEIMRLGAGAMR